MVQMFPLGEHRDLQLAADAFCYQRGCRRYSTEYFCGPVQWALLCPGRNKPLLLAVSRAFSVECLAYIGSFLSNLLSRQWSSIACIHIKYNRFSTISHLSVCARLKLTTW
jgi:hypothetical protein